MKYTCRLTNFSGVSVVILTSVYHHQHHLSIYLIYRKDSYSYCNHSLSDAYPSCLFPLTHVYKSQNSCPSWRNKEKDHRTLSMTRLSLKLPVFLHCHSPNVLGSTLWQHGSLLLHSCSTTTVVVINMIVDIIKLLLDISPSRKGLGRRFQADAFIWGKKKHDKVIHDSVSILSIQSLIQFMCDTRLVLLLFIDNVCVSVLIPFSSPLRAWESNLWCVFMPRSRVLSITPWSPAHVLRMMMTIIITAVNRSLFSNRIIRE